MTKGKKVSVRQEKLAVVRWIKSTEARCAGLEMCGLVNAARVIRKILIKGRR